MLFYSVLFLQSTLTTSNQITDRLLSDKGLLVAFLLEYGQCSVSLSGPFIIPLSGSPQ